MEAEQYRVLRHGIEEKHHESGLQVVAVTSAAPGDGKTLTAVNLAGALAQSPGSRVLLIDADLRCGTVHELLRLSGGRGLVDTILDEALGLDDVVRQPARFNLSVLPVGQTAVAPYELLKSPRFAGLLGGEFVCPALGVRSLAALAGDFALLGRVHSGEASPALLCHVRAP